MRAWAGARLGRDGSLLGWLGAGVRAMRVRARGTVRAGCSARARGDVRDRAHGGARLSRSVRGPLDPDDHPR
jgi:hypothetical protein